MAYNKRKTFVKKKKKNKNQQNNVKVNPVQQTFVERKDKVTQITYTDGITVSELAEKTNHSPSEIIKVLFMMGKMVTINTSLDNETVELICMEYDIESTKEAIKEEDSLEDDIEDKDATLEERSPIVTIMGHVDHGKTTLLDSIRKTKVVDGEFGGITQHIGAYQVKVNGKLITFLDTPGHEAFTAMRARGASVTDIAIIVVAADDGVMPQTREAIDHAKAAEVPIIIAVNKMDKPGANPDRVKNELADLGIMPEEWGGETIFVECSAKTGEGINEILESIIVLSEVLELKANSHRFAMGTVIEAKLDKGRGPVATILVQKGTLKQGDAVVIGSCFGRVRRMTDDLGKTIKNAGPSTPVEIIGLNDVPEAGDVLKAFEDEKEARQLSERRSKSKVDKERKQTSAMSLEDLATQIEEGDIQEIPVIVKADVQGTAEAVAASLSKIDVDGVRVNVIRYTAGSVTESDVLLASASRAMIYGFNVRPNATVRKKAEESGVNIRLHTIIYKAVEEMELAMKGMLAPVFEEVIIGQAEVREIYKVSKVGTIAGCMVTDGKLTKDCKVRLIRDGIITYTGQLGSLKRFQNDAKEVAAGYDCGLTISNFNDIKEKDVIEAYKDQEVAQV